MDVPSILVVGGDGVGKRAVASRLVGSELAGDGHTRAWDIDTKYYTARTMVEIRKLDDEPGSSAAEALVLVFDASDAASYQRTKEWAEAADTSSAEIKLFLANKQDKFKQRSATYQRPPWLLECMVWCSEHLFEYIEVCACSEELDRTLSLEGEAQGMRRVTAALQAHTWPALHMKSHKEQGGTCVPDPQGPGDTETSANFSNLEVSQEASGTRSHPSKDENSSLEFDDEAEVTQYERLVDTMKSARDRVSHMADDERRRVAGDLALRLMAEFGLDEDSEDADHDSD